MTTTEMNCSGDEIKHELFIVLLKQTRGGSRILGKGGLINIFTTGGGMLPPVTARGSGGALIAPPMGSGTLPQPLFAFAFI